MSEKLKPWFVTEPGGPMGRWPGVMEQDGRIIAFAVPDVTTAFELINLRAQLAAATERAEEAEAKLALVDDYGHDQWLSGVSGSEFEAGPYDTFVEWLAERES